ncbi:MAG: CPBP family intramembrane metalloprotease, partial [Clostridia bacterium]|nr:CPBP family intramembrane metalloprotease [Clostridia bacterium]
SYWSVSLQIMYLIVLTFILCPVIIIYMTIWFNEKVEKKLGKNIIQTIKRLTKEIAMFILFLLISTFIISFIFIGKPANQTSVDAFGATSISNMMIIIFMGPIFEEFVFRLLPYKFIKNKTLYITISAFLFAGIHVINDPNPLYYIWCYMPNALYFSYRYHKTNDLIVTISIHSLNNLLSMLPVILSYF